jgi:predicted dienelactone hydrolase
MTGKFVASALALSLSLVVSTQSVARADDPSQDGSYVTHTVTVPATIGGTSGSCDVHLPTAASFARPVVVICHGWLSSSSLYTGIADHLASRGFAAVLFEQPNWYSTDTQSWANQTADVITALAEANAGTGSPVFGELDMNNVGILGHSYGGACVTMLGGQDTRVKCVVALAPVNQYNVNAIMSAEAGMTAPYMAIVGSEDTLLCPDGYPKDFYASAPHSAEREFLEVTGGGHMMYLDGSGQGVIASRHYTAWLERFLEGKADQNGWTTGGAAAAEQAAGQLTDWMHAGSAPAWSATPPALSPLTTTGMLSNGSKGQDVVTLQEKLNELGFYGGGNDGDFGPRTQQAVESFQASKGLTADGVVGPMTRAALGL